MKLRIKETGEVLEDVKFIDTTLHKLTIQYLDNGVLRECIVKNLSDVEEIKDYEEPKEHWAIDQFGEPINVTGLSKLQLEKLHIIGNDFPSENAAMKAIEKLKARKQLEDKGFRFIFSPAVGSLDIIPGKFQIEINADMPAKWFCCDAVQKYLDLLFGGEE